MNKCIHVKSVICKSIVSNVLAFIAIACNVWCNTTIISKNKEIKKKLNVVKLIPITQQSL